MIKTLLQQLEDWFADQDYVSVERVLGELPLEKFTPRMWELFGRSLLQLAQKNEPFSPVPYWRAFNCMSYMLNEQVELFADFNYYSALALAHLDREAEALLFLSAYLEDVMPEFRHPHTEELELKCLQRISFPHYRLGTFVERCRQMGEILQRIERPLTQCAQKIAELSAPVNQQAKNHLITVYDEMDRLLASLARPLLHQVRFSAVWRNEAMVLQIALDGVAQNIHLLHTLLHTLRCYLPERWKVVLVDWKEFVKQHYPEANPQSSVQQLLSQESTYTTSLPPQTASYEQHLQLTSAWTTQPMLVYEYLQDENFMFNLFRLSGCFCGFIAFNTAILPPSDDLSNEVRAFNADLVTYVQTHLDDAAKVQFVGGGFGTNVCEQHAQTAYCDFIAYDAPAVLTLLKDYFAHLPEAHVYCQAFHRAATPFQLLSYTSSSNSTVTV